jgi:hypothetical protein
VPGLLVTTNATIMCMHGGRVTIAPRPGKALVQFGAVLCEPDLVGAPIVGCTLAPSTNTKPCTSVVGIQPGGTSLKVKVGGRPAYVVSLVGITDSLPPGVASVQNPGQMRATG